MRRSYVRKKRINTAAVVLAAVAAMGGTIWGMGALAHDTSANGGESATQKHDNALLEGLIDEKP